ncbi:MAG: thioredoxin-dependent thiol peroxidase [Acidimicrobiales bacterium]|nr:thioredoxin-dependent thiol peroxidase [Acidimicrobiales bacterium]MCB9394092.1 thioredoxin-dependent thiol peroxidase [Acidimicrobiaceae bacterium]
MLTQGHPAPPIVLTNQSEERVDLATLRGKTVLVYFYPKADTPGCTQQACLLRDLHPQLGPDVVILGVSPDKPAALARFRAKYDLGFDLLSDADHAVAEAYGVWQEKKNYGKTYMGIVRSAFLVDADGALEQVWYKISPKDTPVKLLAALEASA